MSLMFSTFVRRLSTGTMELKTVVDRLQGMAPLPLAGSWDNVGLLVEPSAPHNVKKILLTNDLTPPVLNEAIQRKTDMIISYHPPIFSALKRLTQKKWKEEIIVKCIEKRIAVFSPHTTYDCVLGGVNDWLISCFDCENVMPVAAHKELPNQFTHKITFSVDADQQADVTGLMKSMENLSVLDSRKIDGKSYMECLGNMGTVSGLLQCTPSLENLAVTALSQVPKAGYGKGRRGQLIKPITIEEAVSCIKKHLQLKHVRLARTPEMSTVSNVAVWAGSGSSVLLDVKSDLYITGEMSHHEVLHALYNGSAVILCDHSNTERGFLSVLQTRLSEKLDSGVEIEVSSLDADPLIVV